MYSVDNRKWEAVLEYCEENNIAFIPWFPLNAGNVDALDKIRQIAVKHNATTHQVALSWLLHHANNILLIPGTSSVAHLEENMKTADLELILVIYKCFIVYLLSRSIKQFSILRIVKTKFICNKHNFRSASYVKIAVKSLVKL